MQITRVFLSLLLAACMQHALAGDTTITDAIRRHDRIESKVDGKTDGKAGLAAEVRRLIAAGADVNAAAGDGRTALMQAMFGDDEELIELLLAQGANVHATDDRGATALSFAAYRANPRVVAWLLEKGAHRNARNEIDHGILAAFIVNPVSSDTPRAQLDAALKRQIACIGLLARFGVPFDPPPGTQAAGLWLAAEHGRTEVAAEMIRLGANVHATSPMGMTALMHASQGGHTEIVQLLLARGARADTVVSIPGRGATTPLLAAIEGRDEETAMLLLQHTPRALLDVVGPPGYRHGGGSYTALGGAIDNEFKDLVRALVKKGANLNRPGNGRATPLVMAGQQHKLDIVRLLLDHGADLEAKDAEGASALMNVAAFGPNPQALELLIARGARVNARNASGETALDLARRLSSSADNERVLLRHGAVAGSRAPPCHPCRQ